MIKRLAFSIGIACAIGFLAVSGSRAQTPDDVKAAAKELVVAMRATDQLTALMPTVFRVMRPAIVQGRPEVDRDYDTIQRQLSEAFLGRLDEFVEALIIIYARHFTVTELHGLTEFMRSPVGQRFVEKNPVVAQESMVIGQKFGERLALELREKLVEELRRRGHKI
jgi:uncharacterized protein